MYLENYFLYIVGLFTTGTLLSVWFKWTPPARLTRGVYEDYEGWIVHANLNLGLLGRLLTCPFCLSVHVSFWVSLVLGFSFLDPLQDRCLLVVGSFGWPYILQFLDKISRSSTTAGTSPQAPTYSPESVSEVKSEKTPEKEPAKINIDQKKAFLKARGIDGVVDPETGNVVIRAIDPIHAQVQNLFPPKNEPCFFDGCEDLMKKYRDKLNEVENGTCTQCEANRIMQEIYPKLVNKLKEVNGQSQAG